MADLNRWIFTGRLVDVPEPIQNTEGFAVRVATNHFDGKKKEEVGDFFRLEAYGSSANYIRKCGFLFQKGNVVTVEATIRTHNYTNRNGQPVYGYKFYISNIWPVSSGRQQNQSLAQSNDTPNNAVNSGGFMSVPNNTTDDDVPFN